MERRDFLILALSEVVGAASTAAGAIDRKNQSNLDPLDKPNPVSTIDFNVRYRLRSILLLGLGLGLMISPIPAYLTMRSLEKSQSTPIEKPSED